MQTLNIEWCTKCDFWTWLWYFYCQICVTEFLEGLDQYLATNKHKKDVKTCLSKSCFSQIVCDVCHALATKKDCLEAHSIQKNLVKRDKTLQVIFGAMITLKM